MIGRQLGGYRIESVIGRGGMGIVYLAEQIRLERKVALKVITPELAHDVAFRTRFERESRLAAAIDHPNVVPVHEAGEADGLLYIAMRHVQGTDLGALLAHGPLDPRRAAALIGQIADALDAAHARGLVHRDVKPGNVLIEAGAGGERAYLTDFGLSKRLTSASGLTATGLVVGTLDYVAPEQVRGEPLDARTDVYALASLLFHALTGRVPYARDTDMAKMYAHVNDPPPSLLQAAPHLPVAFEDVVQRGMAKDPGARFASAGDLGRAAAAASAGQAPTVVERSVATGAAAAGQLTVAGDTAAPEFVPQTQTSWDSPPPAASPPGSRRSRAWMAAVAGVLVVLGVGAALLLAITNEDGGGADTGEKAEDKPQTAKPKITRQLDLIPLGGGQKQGIAYEAQRGNKQELIVQAQLPPTRRNQAYEVWLYNSDGDALSLGAQVTDRKGNYQGAAPLPASLDRYRFIDVSLEKLDENEAHGGRSVLRGAVSDFRAYRKPGSG